jgi:hypothetical protein
VEADILSRSFLIRSGSGNLFPMVDKDTGFGCSEFVTLEDHTWLIMKREAELRMPVPDRYRRSTAQARQFVIQSVVIDLVVRHIVDTLLAVCLVGQLVTRNIRDGEGVTLSIFPVHVEVTELLGVRHKPHDIGQALYSAIGKFPINKLIASF